MQFEESFYNWETAFLMHHLRAGIVNEREW